MVIKKIAHPSSSSEKLLNAAANHIRVFKNQHGSSYVVIQFDNKTIVSYLDKDTVTAYIRRIGSQTITGMIKKHDVLEVYEAIKSLALTTDEVVNVERRVCQTNNAIFYDLGSDDKVIKITADRISVVTGKSLDFFFVRNQYHSPQVSPQMHVNPGTLPQIISSIFNVDPAMLILFTVYIVCSFVSRINHPILMVSGEKGSAKSTALRQLSSIIDPSKKALFSFPEKTNDLVTVLSNNHVVLFDNVGEISDEAANILCLAATDGSMSKRKLYTDNDEVVINLRRVVALNGVSLNISQSDLLDRAIVVEFRRINDIDRLTEEQVSTNFTAALPNILAASFKLIKSALATYETVNLGRLPRMADFSKFGYCVAEAMGAGLGNRFLQQYEKNIALTSSTAVNNNLLLSCLRDFMRDRPIWQGSMSDLWTALKDTLATGFIGRVPQSFPANASALSRRLNSAQSDLLSVGLEITVGRSADRYITIVNQNIDEVPIDDDDTFSSRRSHRE